MSAFFVFIIRISLTVIAMFVVLQLANVGTEAKVMVLR